MAQYNDLFGFERFAQAQNLARQWDRQREQDNMAQQENALRNALAQQDAQRTGATQNALREYAGVLPDLEASSPNNYNENLAFIRSNLVDRFPQADAAKILGFGKERDIPKPETPKGRKIENFGGVPYLVDGEKVEKVKGYVEPARANNTPFKNERDLRREFTALPEVRAYTEITAQNERLQKAMAENANGGSKIAVDQALITVLNKMLDPSSVVRESEYARTPGDMAFLNRMRGKIDKLKTGGAGLTDEDRQAIANMAGNFSAVSQAMYDEQASYYSDLSNRYGYNPENVVRLGGRGANPIDKGKPAMKTPPPQKQAPSDLSTMSDDDLLKGF